MNIDCMQQGVLVLKCKNCSYTWNTEVEVGQQVDDTCPSCLTHTQRYAVIRPKEDIPVSVDIPEFMSKPKEVITFEVDDLKALTKLHYDLGKQNGLSIGISIGLIILGIVLFFLFAPMTVLPG